MNRRDQRVIMNAIYTGEGHVRPEVQQAVENAIRRYPNTEAEWWLGGVAGIRALLEAIGVDVQAEMEDPKRSGRNKAWDFRRPGSALPVPTEDKGHE